MGDTEDELVLFFFLQKAEVTDKLATKIWAKSEGYLIKCSMHSNLLQKLKKVSKNLPAVTQGLKKLHFTTDCKKA